MIYHCHVHISCIHASWHVIVFVLCGICLDCLSLSFLCSKYILAIFLKIWCQEEVWFIVWSPSSQALDAFNSAVISPVYYVMFTTFTILASMIMFKVSEPCSMESSTILDFFIYFMVKLLKASSLNFTFSDWRIFLLPNYWKWDHHGLLNGQ